MISNLNMSHEKMSGFVWFPLSRITLVIKLRNFHFESHWNILIFSDEERYGLKFECVSWKNVWYVSFPLFGFTLVIKLGNFDFKGHWNTLIFSVKK